MSNELLVLSVQTARPDTYVQHCFLYHTFDMSVVV